MARMTRVELGEQNERLALEVVIAEEKIEALKTENEQLRALCSEWASDAKRARREIVKLKDRLSAGYRDMREDRRGVPSIGDVAAMYCERFGVKSVSKAQLEAFLQA
jgi:chromosome segregation ATPase